MTASDGWADRRYQGVADAFAALIDGGHEVGASASVVVDGRCVVDVWGGFADEARTIPWQRDTIVNVWSLTKTMTALVALVLADHGEIDLDAPVARYWPEFAANGKDGVLVRHVLSHTSGVAGWDVRLSIEDLYDGERCSALLADQAPWWAPGSASGYHALTFGVLVGEVVQRVTGHSLGSLFAKEMAAPLGADFHIGLGAEHDHRVALVVPPPPAAPPEGFDPDGIAARILTNPLLRAKASWTEAWRRAEIPSANGHGNARSVAAVQSVLACGGEVGGVRLLSEAGCRRALHQEADGIDLAIGTPVRFGPGYALNSPHCPIGPNPGTCFWAGWGGSFVLVDFDARMAVAYVMNRMENGTHFGDFRSRRIVAAAYEALTAGP